MLDSLIVELDWPTEHTPILKYLSSFQTGPLQLRKVITVLNVLKAKEIVFRTKYYTHHHTCELLHFSGFNLYISSNRIA